LTRTGNCTETMTMQTTMTPGYWLTYNMQMIFTGWVATEAKP